MPPPWRTGGLVGPSRVRARGPSCAGGGPVWPGQAPTSSLPPAAGPSLPPKGRAGGPGTRSALRLSPLLAAPVPAIQRGEQRSLLGASTGRAAPILEAEPPGSASAGLLPSFPLVPAGLPLFPSVLRLLLGLLFPAFPRLPFLPPLPCLPGRGGTPGPGSLGPSPRRSQSTGAAAAALGSAAVEGEVGSGCANEEAEEGALGVGAAVRGACCWLAGLVRVAFSSLLPLKAAALEVPGTVGAPDRWWSIPPAPGLCAQQLQKQPHLQFQDLPDLQFQDLPQNQFHDLPHLQFQHWPWRRSCPPLLNGSSSRRNESLSALIKASAIDKSHTFEFQAETFTLRARLSQNFTNHKHN